VSARKAKRAADNPIPYLPILSAAVPPSPDMCAKAAEPPRNKAADLARAEAFYVNLRDVQDFLPLDWDVWRAFQRAVAASITEMRLGR
jgi:hypothetical protein